MYGRRTVERDRICNQRAVNRYVVVNAERGVWKIDDAVKRGARRKREEPGARGRLPADDRQAFGNHRAVDDAASVDVHVAVIEVDVEGTVRSTPAERARLGAGDHD